MRKSCVSIIGISYAQGLHPYAQESWEAYKKSRKGEKIV